MRAVILKKGGGQKISGATSKTPFSCKVALLMRCEKNRAMTQPCIYNHLTPCVSIRNENYGESMYIRTDSTITLRLRTIVESDIKHRIGQALCRGISVVWYQTGYLPQVPYTGPCGVSFCQPLNLLTIVNYYTTAYTM